MGIGKLTTGDDFLDELMYMAIAIVIVIAFILFILPIIEIAFNMTWIKPWF